MSDFCTLVIVIFKPISYFSFAIASRKFSFLIFLSEDDEVEVKCHAFYDHKYSHLIIKHHHFSIFTGCFAYFSCVLQNHRDEGEQRKLNHRNFLCMCTHEQIIRIIIYHL